MRVIMPTSDVAAFQPFDAELTPARFLRRPNRFVVHARLEAGREVRAHLSNPGRLEEILQAGRPLRLRAAEREDRKTDWTAVLARTPGGEGWVSLVTTIPNRLVGEALSVGELAEVGGWSLDRAEAPVGESRIDFLLARDGRRLALEVKSVTLERRGAGLFPDAVTDRGTRHLRELIAVTRRRGWEAGVLFVAQRDDVTSVTAAPDIDPTFAATLAEARGAGVRAWARRCRVTPAGVGLGRAVPVLGPEEAPPPPDRDAPTGEPSAGARGGAG